mmetsp:Transcript_81290/g.263666  ORF Transcript_81290/g.263666 Transcript_81290/m.263666 type:complete len:203 (-) Transcript_81290:1337-1945(-)
MSTTTCASRASDDRQAAPFRTQRPRQFTSERTHVKNKQACSTKSKLRPGRCDSHDPESCHARPRSSELASKMEIREPRMTSTRNTSCWRLVRLSSLLLQGPDDGDSLPSARSPKVPAKPFPGVAEGDRRSTRAVSIAAFARGRPRINGPTRQAALEPAAAHRLVGLAEVEAALLAHGQQELRDVVGEQFGGLGCCGLHHVGA